MNTIQIPASYYGYNHSLPFDWPQVLRLEGQRNYTIFVLTNGARYLSTKNLGAYEAHLPSDFLRIHKRCIIHRASIAEIYPRSRTIRLHDGTELGIARRRWGEIRSAYKS